MLGAVALFTACSDDGGSGSGNINYEEGYKYLTNLNVSDAKMIYQKSSATRATQGTTLITNLIYQAMK